MRVAIAGKDRFTRRLIVNIVQRKGVQNSTCEEKRDGRLPQLNTNVSLLTGGIDRPYVFGLAMALASKGVHLDIIGSDVIARPELHNPPTLNFLNLRGDMRSTASLREKAIRVLMYYARLIRYASIAKPRIFHILWDNKFFFFDRTALMLYYKLMGKKIACTAMNINAGKRDGNDSRLNRLTLTIQYRLADHLFVHTEKMKRQLLEGFGVREKMITVISMGINKSVPNTDLTPAEAKDRLGIGSDEKTILFFGGIQPYKGLEYLVAAFQLLASERDKYRLIIAGAPTQSAQYWVEIKATIEKHPSRTQIIQRIEFVPDAETELFFKAADVAALPYTDIFQSGVLVLSYGFGLPVIATDVGSLRQDIIEGKTGYVCKPLDPVDLARAIRRYFDSDLYRRLDEHRDKIRAYASTTNSWDVTAQRISAVYADLLGTRP
jgi:glycosyltransferase involved in cell wall biosynthesis